MAKARLDKRRARLIDEEQEQGNIGDKKGGSMEKVEQVKNDDCTPVETLYRRIYESVSGKRTTRYLRSSLIGKEFAVVQTRR